MARPEVQRPLQILCLSAKSELSLAEMARRYRRHLVERPSSDLSDLCFTAGTGRAHFGHRTAMVVESRQQAIEALGNCAQGEAPGAVMRGNSDEGTDTLKVAFLFTGQGAQHAGMGQRLYETEPAFREALDACAAGLKPHLPKPLLEVMFAPRGDRTIDETQYAQPALFALEYSLFRLWEQWGVRPFAVLGHSVGEYAAACAAGVVDLASALALVAARGRLMQALPRAGAMVSVQAGEAEAREAAAPYGARVSIAAVNGPQSTVLSGEREAVAAATEALRTAGVRTRELSVSHAFHSALLDPMLDEFERAARAASYRAPQCHLVANLTGELFAPGQVPDAAYWRRHAREPVLFEAGVRALSSAGANVFIEIGPQPVLTSMAKQLLDGPHTWVASLREDRDDLRQMLESVAELYVRGAAIRWPAFYAGRGGRKVSAPTYPFERKRHWIEPEPGRHARAPSAALHPLLGRRLPSALSAIQFESELGADAPEYLTDHRIYGLPLFPAAGYLELAFAAARELRGDGPCELEDVRFERAMILQEDGGCRAQVVLSPEAEGELRFEVHSQTAGDRNPAAPWVLHARCKLRLGAGASPEPVAYEHVGQTGDRAQEQNIPVADHYKMLTDRGMRYTRSFAGLRELYRGPHGSGTGFGRVALGEPGGEQVGRHVAHPALVDSCLHVLSAALATKFAAGNAIRMAYVPAGVRRARLYRPLGEQASCYAKIHLDSSGLEYSADLWIFDASGAIALEIEGLRMHGVERSRLRDATIAQQGSVDFVQRLAEAPPEDRRRLLMDFITEQVADVMGVDAASLEESMMFFELGMGSLSSVELQYRLQKNLRCELQSLIIDYQSTETLADYLLPLVLGLGLEAAERKDV